MNNSKISRRKFLKASGIITGASLVSPTSALNANFANIANASTDKLKVALVGTGYRGVRMWGKDLVDRYSNQLEFVGLCDSNEGRLQAGKKWIGADCNTYMDFTQMMKESKPDMLIVTTPDHTHDEFIIKGMEMGAHVLTEKPLTTDEKKVQAILDAERRTGKDCRITFNYRYSPHRAKIWELLRNGEIGEITSVDFHWYLDTSHGADYFRRWHRKIENSGSLWVHKASHHFDLLNWWINSDPESVYALGSLDFYGKNGKFRGENCRSCQHKKKCDFYWDVTKNEAYKTLYVDNEQYDGYNRDGCVFRNDINIYDKMAATIKYMNGVQVSYSLTTYSPYEGYRIAFNGTKGRIDAWIEESQPRSDVNYDEIVLFKNFSKRIYIPVPHATSGHGGGDSLLQDQIFLPNMSDDMQQCASLRDGALACLVGIGAYRSIQQQKTIHIKDLTTIKPQVVKEYKRVK